MVDGTPAGGGGGGGGGGIDEGFSSAAVEFIGGGTGILEFIGGGTGILGCFVSSTGETDGLVLAWSVAEAAGDDGVDWLSEVLEFWKLVEATGDEGWDWPSTEFGAWKLAVDNSLVSTVFSALITGVVNCQIKY